MKSDLRAFCERLLDCLKEQQEALERALFKGGDDAVLFDAYRELDALGTEEESLKRDIRGITSGPRP